MSPVGGAACKGHILGVAIARRNASQEWLICIAKCDTIPDKLFPALHSVVWKFCPKELFLGKISVDTACAMPVCSFNDGATSLSTIASRLGLEPSPFCEHHLKRKDAQRIQGSKYKSSQRAKKLRRVSMRKRKGLDDKQ